MAEKTTEARTYECDADACDVEHVCVGDQQPKGFRLTAQHGDGKPVKVYACKATHMRPAVEAALVKASAEQPDDTRSDEERDTDEQFDAARAAGNTTHADGLRVADGEDEALEEDVPVAVGQ